MPSMSICIIAATANRPSWRRLGNASPWRELAAAIECSTMLGSNIGQMSGCYRSLPGAVQNRSNLRDGVIQLIVCCVEMGRDPDASLRTKVDQHVAARKLTRDILAV